MDMSCIVRHARLSYHPYPRALSGTAVVPILLTCACTRILRVKDELAGRKVRCPDCGSVQTVPEPAGPDRAEDQAGDVLLSGPPAPATPPATAVRAEPPPPLPPLRRPATPAAPPAPVARPPRMARADRPRRLPRVAFEEGWFGSLNAGAIGGILMMLIAVVWFVAGLAGGIIFFYPPVLLVIGFLSFLKGLAGGD